MISKRLFFLHLAHGQCWQFLSDSCCQGLMEQLATLMQLGSVGPVTSLPLILTHAEPLAMGDGLWRLSPSASLASDVVPQDGWKLQSVGQMGLMTHPASASAVCIVGKELLEKRRIAAVWPVVTPISREVQQTGGLIAHSSLLVHDEQAVLLVGPSGMGKSTCARRIGHPWSALCDDQALVVNVSEGRYRCHPLPTWSALWGNPEARSWNVQDHVPLHAIFFLQRADENRVEPCGKGRAAALLSQAAQSMAVTQEVGSCIDEEIARRSMIFGNACAVVQSVPCFVLHANLTTRFWEHMESVL